MKDFFKVAMNKKLYITLILLVFITAGYFYSYFLINQAQNINHLLHLVLFFDLGIFVSIGFVFLSLKLDTTIKSQADIEKYIGLNVLAQIPKIAENTIITNQYDKSDIVEKYQKLKNNINFAQVGVDIKNIIVTSADEKEGKSTVAANLAITYAKSNIKTLLIDADLRKGVQHNNFGLKNEIGLSDYLLETELDGNIGELATYIQASNVQNLSVMTVGTDPPNPTELLTSDNKFKEMLDILNLLYDVIVIDTCALTVSGESAYVSKYVDTVLVVASANETKRELLQKLQDIFASIDVKICGIVLNKTLDEAKAINKKEVKQEKKVLEDNVKIAQNVDNNDIKKEEINQEVQQEKQQETVEQLIERLNKSRQKTEILVNTQADEKALIDSNFVNNNYNIDDIGEFKLQIKNIGNEINNIKQIFEKVLSTDAESSIKNVGISEPETKILIEKLDDLKDICTSLNIVKSDNVVEKVRDEISRLETVYNSSKNEDLEYIINIEQRIEKMKELQCKSMKFENAVSAKTIEQIGSVKQLILDLRGFINDRIAYSGKDTNITQVKEGLGTIEYTYSDRLDERLRHLEDVILTNLKIEKNDNIAKYFEDMQEEFAVQLEKKFLNLQDAIEQNQNSENIENKLEELKNEYYENLQEECEEIKQCIKNNENSDKLEELLVEVKNNSISELENSVDELKELFEKEANNTDNINTELSEIRAICEKNNLDSIVEKIEDLKDFGTTELKDRLQVIYNLYSQDIDDGVDRIKEFANGKFDNIEERANERYNNLKEYAQSALEELRNVSDENTNTLSDKLDDMHDKYSIELTAKIDDIQLHYTDKMEQFTEYSEDKFNDLKDKLDELQDRYFVEMEAKIADIQENYTNKLDELNIAMSESNKEQLLDVYDKYVDELQDKIAEINATLTETNKEQVAELNEKLENFENRIIDLQRLQNQNSKTVEVKEVKNEVENLKAKIEEQNPQNEIASLKAEIAKLQKRIKAKDTSIEDEMYNMKQELVKLRKELELSPKKEKVNQPQQQLPANVYRYSDYDEVVEKKSLFGKKSSKKQPIDEGNIAAASSISQILKF